MAGERGEMKKGWAAGEEGKTVPLNIRFLSASKLHGELIINNCTDQEQVHDQS